MLERGPSLAARVAGSPQLRRRQALTARICRLLGRVQLTGLDLVPDTGPAILAVNHTSLMDGPLPVRRYRIDPGPVRYGLALLRAGGILGMFPEGSRGVGLAGSVRPGVGYFAVKTGASVLPVAVLGSGRTVRTLGRPPVRIRFGEPLTFPAAGPVVNRGRWLAAAESVRLALAELVAETAADLVTDRGRPQLTMEA